MTMSGDLSGDDQVGMAGGAESRGKAGPQNKRLIYKPGEKMTRPLKAQ